MQKYWAWLGLNLGKHAGIVSIVGLLITITLGFGITKLEFATGQDSYLNKNEDVYKNSLAYQDLFGGQAMVTLVTLGEGEELTDLFTPEAVAQWEAIEAEIKETGGDDIFGVVTPLTALQFTNDLVLPPSGNVVEGVAAQILLGATERDPTPEGKAIRTESSAETLTRVNEIPPEDRVIGNEAWNDFLLHDNTGEIRKSLWPFFPNEGNAQMVVRLPGNLDIETEGQAAQIVQDAAVGPQLRRRHDQHHRRGRAAARSQRLPHQRHARARRHRRRPDGDHPAGRLRRALAAAAAGRSS